MTDPQGLHVETIRTDELGDRSYVVHDGATAFVIDPQRDVDRITALLDGLGLTVAAVGETHIHNDYLTGGLVLARTLDAPYLIGALDEVEYARKRIEDDEWLRAGSLDIRVVATPGHTPGHVSFVVTSASGATAAFTGGSLLYGAVGRTDLIDESLTRELTVAQYRSVRRLAELLPDDAQLFPTHGFGSFCSSGPPLARSDNSGTVAAERTANPALLEQDEEAFVERIITGFTPYPAYYSRMAPRNRAGVAAADLRPAPHTDTQELRRRLDAGEWVVDLRNRRDFAADHIAGTLAFELGPQFATYLGWIYPYDEPLTLLAETEADLAAAQRQLVRVGIDRPSAASHGRLDEIAPGLSRRSFATATFADLVNHLPDGASVIDVRRPDEIARDGTVPGSLHLPITELIGRIHDLPAGVLWIHCASGFRATIAASLLDRANREVVLVDDTFASFLSIVS